MKTLCVDLGGSRVKLALMTADSHPQPDVFEVDSRAPLAQTLSLVAQHAAAWGQPDAVSIALPCVVCRGTVIACNGNTRMQSASTGRAGHRRHSARPFS